MITAYAPSTAHEIIFAFCITDRNIKGTVITMQENIIQKLKSIFNIFTSPENKKTKKNQLKLSYKGMH